MANELIQKFIKNRRYLTRGGVKLEYIEGDNSPYIFIDNPVVIAGFAGFIKNHVINGEVYFRGEPGNYQHIVPSLFREGGSPLTSNELIQKRYRAYAELKFTVYNHFKNKVSRFKKEEIDNLFQHYGIRSPVIDMVDNIYIAIWFAMYGNRSAYGYIRLMQAASPDLTISDLRKTHSSLSLRLHTQHGLIAKKKVSGWNKSNIYYDGYEVARIKFPVSKGLENGVLFSAKNIYPSTRLDNTFKILKNETWLLTKIESLEKKYQLNQGDLGRIK